MDATESIAFRYLTSLQIGQVAYEPDGNVPPDFVVDGRIAVEVRRLNQNSTIVADRLQGLEELAIPLSQKIRRLLREQGPSLDGECWYVGYGFRRPLPPWSRLRPLVEQELRRFRQLSGRRRSKVKLTRGFDMDYAPAGMDHGAFFVLGAYMDEDSGGWVMAELARNLRLCISDKEAKLQVFRARYPIWWLVLVDHIDDSVDYADRDRFRQEVMPNIQHSFDKLVLLDPREELRPFEI